MAKEEKTRRQFTKDFKNEAVRMILDEGMPLVEVARTLDVHKNQLYNWKEEHLKSGVKAFPGRGKGPSTENELQKLQAELARVKEERDILKKAVAIFSQPEPRSIASSSNTGRSSI